MYVYKLQLGTTVYPHENTSKHLSFALFSNQKIAQPQAYSPACDPGMAGASRISQSRDCVPHAQIWGPRAWKGGGLKPPLRAFRRKAWFYCTFSSVQDPCGRGPGLVFPKLPSHRPEYAPRWWRGVRSWCQAAWHSMKYWKSFVNASFHSLFIFIYFGCAGSWLWHARYF